MSSSTYSARISPDPRLRRYLLATACLLIAAGVWLIAEMPVGRGWRIGLVFCWGWLAGRPLAVTLAAYRRVAGYEVRADGHIELIGHDGRRRSARLSAGSRVLPRLAWLRVRAPGGQTWGELVAPPGAEKCRQIKDWRRFQVICRHVSAC